MGVMVVGDEVDGGSGMGDKREVIGELGCSVLGVFKYWGRPSHRHDFRV